MKSGGSERKEEIKCHKTFCGSTSSCDCPSDLLASSSDLKDDYENDDDHVEQDETDDDEDERNTLESSHWALEVLYEDFGMLSS